MDEHVCDWQINSPPIPCLAICKECLRPMDWIEAEARLNATEVLSAEVARDIVYGIEETLAGAKPRFEDEHVPTLHAYALDGEDDETE